MGWVSFSVALHLIALRQGLILNRKFTASARLAGQSSPDLFVDNEMLGLQARAATTGFLCGC